MTFAMTSDDSLGVEKVLKAMHDVRGLNAETAEELL